MVVLKFGGSSIANAERIKNVVSTIKESYTSPFTVVFSAFGGITDLLVQMSRGAEAGNKQYFDQFEAFCQRHLEIIENLFLEPDQCLKITKKIQASHDVLRHVLQGVYLVREASPRTTDYILSFGERNASYIISEYMKVHGIDAEFLDARDIIKTNKAFGAAIVDWEITYQNIKAYYQRHDKVQVVTGFISSAKGGLTTTLGRGGSDYTAALLAAGLNATRLEIWTDVNGVLTSDPRKVKKAFTIPKLSFQEAMEMSHFGAKVIYPPTIQPILNKEIPLIIKNSFNPSFEGTLIEKKNDPLSPAVKGISSISNIALLTLQGSGLFGVPGIAARLFGALAKRKINVILITQGSSEHSISFAVNPKDATKAKMSIVNEFALELEKGLVEPIKIESDLAVVAIIGENMRYRPGIAGRLFTALGRNGINVIAIAQGSSELNISVVINSHNEAKALNTLHEAFFLSDTNVLNLFVIGIGLIGGTLIQQISNQAKQLSENQSLEINVIGIANTQKMLFVKEGINLKTWKDDLITDGVPSNLLEFVKQMKKLNLSNSIFVDNTSSPDVTDLYKDILDASISISTPNKLATSSSLSNYYALKELATKKGVLFRYETNVGAGLPVITTLNDLMNSGDEIMTIEGVFSGSLSYIFNSFNSSQLFSEVVLEAKKLGLTEPDPRQDLSLMDFKRKLVILAREVGFKLETKNIASDNLLNDDLINAESVEAFLQKLPSIDPDYKQLMLDAESKNNKLRVVGSISSDLSEIKLKQVDSSNPFYNLDGSDNMIVITTKRYAKRPLVIKGPGAGAEVTAAGVFAEIIYIGNRLAKSYK